MWITFLLTKLTRWIKSDHDHEGRRKYKFKYCDNIELNLYAFICKYQIESASIQETDENKYKECFRYTNLSNLF